VSVAVTNGNQRATTDANGVAAFRMQKSRVTEQSRLRLVVASNESIEVPMPASGGEARLQLPECGRVHATYTGSLLPGSTLSWSLRQGDRRMTPDLQGERDATFNFVQVGYEGDLQVVADSSTTTASVDGVTAGATIERTLARKAGERCVVVRPLSPDGAPVENGYVDANWEFRNGSSSSGATTNAAGWLEVAVPDRAETAKVRLLLHRGGWNGPIVGSLEVAVEAADQGRIERGEVRVTPPKVALAGEVVDTAGRPLRGVNLRVSGPTSVQVESNADGRFEIALPAIAACRSGARTRGEWLVLRRPAGHVAGLPDRRTGARGAAGGGAAAFRRRGADTRRAARLPRARRVRGWRWAQGRRPVGFGSRVPVAAGRPLALRGDPRRSRGVPPR
jgi:hypothetical protein